MLMSKKYIVEVLINHILDKSKVKLDLPFKLDTGERTAIKFALLQQVKIINLTSTLILYKSEVTCRIPCHSKTHI